MLLISLAWQEPSPLKQVLVLAVYTKPSQEYNPCMILFGDALPLNIFRLVPYNCESSRGSNIAFREELLTVLQFEYGRVCIYRYAEQFAGSRIGEQVFPRSKCWSALRHICESPIPTPVENRSVN